MGSLLAVADPPRRRNLLAYRRGDGHGLVPAPDRSVEFDERLRRLEEAPQAGTAPVPAAPAPAEVPRRRGWLDWVD